MRINQDNFADEAEKVINNLLKTQEGNQKDRAPKILTTSKIRNLLAMNVDIYNELMNHDEDELTSEQMGRIQYLKIRMLYEAGRDISVRNFVTESGLVKIIDEIDGKKSNYILFSRYMEALVAYRKFLGGRDE